jgi:hypothetical protein
MSVSQAQIDGLTATAIIELAFGTVVQRSLTNFSFDGNWRIDHEEPLAPAIPSGTTTVDMKLQEYAFVYDKAAITSGNVAFRVQNVGKEAHEVALIKLATSAPLLQVLQDEDFLAEVEVVGVAGPYDPGTGTNVVFTKPLAAGRYGLVCFIPAPDGTPHAFLGMVSDFNVGGGITPPSTGDAGLASGPDGAKLYGSLSVAIVAFALAGGLVLLSRRRA